MGYRNQQIIKDVYGLGAQGAALDKINASIAKGMSDINAAAALQTKIAMKEKENSSKLYAQSSIRQNQVVNGLETKGFNGVSLTEQSIQEIRDIMDGKDGVIGSIDAEALLQSTTATREEKKKYQDIINTFDKATGNFVKHAALVETDKAEFLKHANDPSSNDYLAGDTSFDRNKTFLAASSLFNRALPKGIDLTSQTKNGNNLGLTFSVPENYGPFKDNKDFETIKSINGKKTVKWNVDLSTWNGQFVNKLNIEVPDYKTVGEDTGAVKNGMINPQYQSLLATVQNRKPGTKQQVSTTDSYVNVNAFLNQFSDTNTELAENIWSDLQSSPQSGNAYLRKVLEKSGKNYLELFANGNMTEDQILNEIKGFADDATKRKFNVQNGAIVEDTSDPGNNLKMIQRPITQSDINQLIARKIPGAESLEPNSMQYFYRKEKAGDIDQEGSQIKNWRLRQIANLTDQNFVGTVILGNRSSYGGESKVFIEKQNGVWVPMQYVAINSKDTEDDMTTTVKVRKAVRYKGDDYPKSSTDPNAYFQYLNY